MQYEIIKGFQKNKAYRDSFNALAEKTFGLNFENWYTNGFWNEKYIPYSVLKDGEIIANVSVNLIDCTLDGQKKRYIQLGTVMTDEKHRCQGYSRKLIETVLVDFAECDGFYLYANDEVTDFYPKFSFVKSPEYRFRTKAETDKQCCAVSVPMKNREDWTKFLNAKKSLKSIGLLQTDTDDLMMFYLSQFMTESVFYIEHLNAYVIAETENDTLTVYDILSENPIDINEVCNAFGNKIKKAEFAFTPQNTSSLEKYEYHEPDTTFFILGEPITSDMQKILSFPQLTHA